MLKYLLFDLDGTLIDSSRCVYKVYTDIFNELGITVPEEKTLRTFIGPPIEEVIVKYYKGDIKTVCNRFREIYATLDLVANNKLFPDVAKMLKTLKGMGYKICLATTKFYVFAEEILHNMGIYDYFDIIMGSNANVGRVGKKDVLNALLSAGVEKDKCILIGDTKFDAEGAKSVGIPIAIVDYGFGRREDFASTDVIWYAESVMDIVDKVKHTTLEN
jgi:phosphoglycolate phosphatase